MSSSRHPLFNSTICYLGDLNQRIGVATVGGEGAPAGRDYRSPPPQPPSGVPQKNLARRSGLSKLLKVHDNVKAYNTLTPSFQTNLPRVMCPSLGNWVYVHLHSPPFSPSPRYRANLQFYFYVLTVEPLLVYSREVTFDL